MTNGTATAELLGVRAAANALSCNASTISRYANRDLAAKLSAVERIGAHEYDWSLSDANDGPSS